MKTKKKTIVVWILVAAVTALGAVVIGGCGSHAPGPHDGELGYPCNSGACDADLVCHRGTCTSCGDAGEWCCPGGHCNDASLRCEPGRGQCNACGQPGQRCCIADGDIFNVCFDGASCNIANNECVGDTPLCEGSFTASVVCRQAAGCIVELPFRGTSLATAIECAESMACEVVPAATIDTAIPLCEHTPFGPEDTIWVANTSVEDAIACQRATQPRNTYEEGCCPGDCP